MCKHLPVFSSFPECRYFRSTSFFGDRKAVFACCRSCSLARLGGLGVAVSWRRRRGQRAKDRLPQLRRVLCIIVVRCPSTSLPRVCDGVDRGRFSPAVATIVSAEARLLAAVRAAWSSSHALSLRGDEPRDPLRCRNCVDTVPVTWDVNFLQTEICSQHSAIEFFACFAVTATNSRGHVTSLENEVSVSPAQQPGTVYHHRYMNSQTQSLSKNISKPICSLVHLVHSLYIHIVSCWSFL